MRSSEELANEIATKEKEKLEADKLVEEVEQEDLGIAYQIDKLRVKRRENAMALVKAKFNSRKLGTEIKLLTTQFWSSKHSGL